MRFFAAIALAALLAGLYSPAAEAARKKGRRDARTVGLGRSCSAEKPCAHKRQRCIKQIDANGKDLPTGFCVLPCRQVDAGLKKDDPPPPFKEGVVKASPAPRCPKKYQCRTKGAGVPFDICVGD